MLFACCSCWNEETCTQDVDLKPIFSDKHPRSPHSPLPPPPPQVRRSGDPESLWSLIKDAKWATQSCAAGWGLQGTLAKFDDRAKLTAAARSLPLGGGGGARPSAVLATGDSFSRVRLWRYPAAAPNLRRVLEAPLTPPAISPQPSSLRPVDQEADRR